MSSGDVIELGSSDEDAAEPAPKKIKKLPNTMVTIPKKIHEVTIKPAKTNAVSVAKGLVGKGITVTKVPKKQTSSTNLNPCPVLKKPVPIIIKPIIINPSIIKPSNSKNLSIQKIKTNTKISAKFSSNRICKPQKDIQLPIQKSEIRVPSAITIRNSMSQGQIITLNSSKNNAKKGNQRSASSTVGEVLTVELDDDETPAPSSNPQWYLRPEEQLDAPTQEDQNNKEPKNNLIEITIEDSPVKLLQNKRTHEVGAELAITIDDSPIKLKVDKDNFDSESDNEDRICSVKEPQSKKKLAYPKEVEDRKTVEIEIDPLIYTVDNHCNLEGRTVDVIISIDDEKNNSNAIPKDYVPETSLLNKVNATPAGQNRTDIPSESEEFHPVYQSFIDLCFQLENSEDMKKIVEKKIKGYYRQVPKEYTESEEFTDMVSSKILAMQAGPEKMYLYIKDIVDELNLQRKLAKSLPPIKETKTEEPVNLYGEESKFGFKRQRQIRKLEKTIKKLHRAIQKLEKLEVDFDDDDDSAYLLTERYKERMVRVYAKFCQLSNTKMPSEPRIHIDARPGQPSGPAKRLEKWINKKVPIGTPLPFPDFHDVLHCVRQANDEDKLGFNEADIMEEARDLFTRCGKKLQRRRQENEWRLAASRIAQDVDPAEASPELRQKLNENRKASRKETEIFNKFVDRQYQLKLEAVEIGDKEAEESPVESGEEEEANDENVSLENSEKRRVRLKRLLNEKSKKSSEEKENQPSNDEQKNENESSVSEKTEIEVMKDKERDTDDLQKPNVNSKENASDSNKDTETLTLSDDSNELDSDIDELNLLQKLHYETEEQSSNVDSSDSESPIAISDSLESSEENKIEIKDDVLSIEDSSYSEDEGYNIDHTQEINTETVEIINENSMPSPGTQISSETKDTLMEVEICIAKDPSPSQTNNEGCNEIDESILSASVDDDNCDSQASSTEAACVNLRDEMISIDEPVIDDIIKVVPEKESNKKINEMETDEANTYLTPTKVDNHEEKNEANGVINCDKMSSESVENMDVADNSINAVENLDIQKENVSENQSMESS